jgi:hypothetical protein
MLALRSLFVSFLLLICSLSAFTQQTKIHYLSGTDKDHTVQWDFLLSNGRNSGKWTKIPVPSNWELQGFGEYNYGWEEDYTKNETGYYKHSFQTDPAWKDKTVKIVFEGSMTDTEVKINGKSAGPIHQGSFYRFKYDITDLLKPGGENLLEVTVHKISSDTSVNRAERMSDFWVFGGIFRPVYLEVLPKQYIEWSAIDAKVDGSFLAEVYPENIQDGNIIEAQIKTLDGKPVGNPFTTTFKKDDSKVTLRKKVAGIKTWTPESPNRYNVELRLKNAKGIIHTITEKFGFRTVEFKPGAGFFVNGRKVMFKGVNRHSFWPSSGRTTSKELSIMDVNLMKDMNMNAVRMAHYPPDDHFLDACDSLGLFVLDELGGWQKKYDTEVGRKLLKEMIMKDVNHPSIVIWDNGNEGGNNFDLDDDFALYDPQKRHVIHPWNVFKETDTQHYKPYGCCVGSLYNGNLVFFPTEILHGLYDGGHGAGLDDHWNLMLNNPLSAGCFLWVFADEGVVRTDKDSVIDVKGDRAPDGIVGPFREKEGSFYTIKEIWSPVYIGMQKITPEFNGILPVENRYHYTKLDQVKFKWQLVKLPVPTSADTVGTVLGQRSFTGPSIAPQEGGNINLLLPADFRKADVLYLSATDNHGRELFTWSWPVKTPQQINQTYTATGKEGKITVKEALDLLSVSSNGVTINFDQKTGMIAGVQNTRSSISLNGGPSLAEGEAKFQSLKHYAQGANHIIEMNYSGNLKKVQYTMMPSGILKMEYAYSLYNNNPGNAFDYMGISFNYPEEKVTGVKYLGRGPYRVWKNRMKGGRFNVWQKKYNNTVTGESWDYPEFKGYYRDFNWVVIENKESTFKVFTDTENMFLRLYTPEKPNGARNDNTSPAFPKGDISFLNAINAIGTKFDKAEVHGPESQKNRVGWVPITNTLYIDFR